MSEDLRVTATVEVETDEERLALDTDAEQAVTELLAEGIAGEVRVDVEGPPGTAPEAHEQEERELAPPDEEEEDAEVPPGADPLEDEPPASKATFKVYEDNAGRWRWRLVHDNGNIIADSGGSYASQRGAMNSLRSVKRNAPGGPVTETED